MKFKSIFATALVGLTVSSLTSCSQDDVITPEMGGVSGSKSGNYVSVSLKPNFNQLKRTRAEIGTSFMEEPGTGIFNPFSGNWRINLIIYKDTIYDNLGGSEVNVHKIILRDSVYGNTTLPISDVTLNYRLEKGSTYHIFALLQKGDYGIYKLGYQQESVYTANGPCGDFIPTIEYDNPDFWKSLPRLNKDSWENQSTLYTNYYETDLYKSVFVDGKYGDAYYAETQIYVNNTYESVDLSSQLEFKRFLSFVRIASDNANDLSCTLYGCNGNRYYLPIGLKYKFENRNYPCPFETIWSEYGDAAYNVFYSHNVESSYEFTYNGKHYKSMLNAFLFPAIDRETNVDVYFVKNGNNLCQGRFPWPTSSNAFTTIIPAEERAFTIGNVGLQNATVLSGFN